MSTLDTSPASPPPVAAPVETREWLDKMVVYQNALAERLPQEEAVEEQLNLVATLVSILYRLLINEHDLCIGWHKYIRELARKEGENRTEFSSWQRFGEFQEWVNQPYKPGEAADEHT